MYKYEFLVDGFVIPIYADSRFEAWEKLRERLGR